MRADRLLAIMLLLQARGKMTTQALASELEVSRRTILRDVGALSVAGVPVYAEGGHGGGIALDAQYRVTLTGLTEAELHTLFVSGLPNALQDLGYRPQAEHTLRKLFAALPSTHRDAVEQFRQRIHVDPVWWWNEVASAHWDTLQRAVFEERMLRVAYRRHDETEAQRDLEPYSLVVKAGIWYLVARREGEFRTYRVSRLGEVILLDTVFQRLPDFDLAAYWREHTERMSRQLAPYAFTLRFNEAGHAFLKRHTLELTAISAAPGWYTAELRVASQEEARMLVFGLGADGEVITPQELHDAVRQIARRIVSRP